MTNHQTSTSSNRPSRRGFDKNLALFLVLTLAGHHAAAFTPAPHHLKTAHHSVASNTNPFTVQETMVWAQPPQSNEEFGDHSSLENADLPSRKSTDPTSVMENTFGKMFKSAKSKQAALAAVAMLAMAPLPSNAAMSGGRMGGSFSSPAPRMQSMPRSSGSRGYSGGGGGGYGRGFSSGYASGLGTGYMTAPRIGYSPFAPSLYRPYTPYYGGSGVISYNSGPSLGQLVFFGGLAFAVSSALNKETTDWTGSMDMADGVTSVLGPGTSFVKISVALDVPNRDDPGSIVSVLNRLGQSANTDTRKGIQNLTSQVALEVLRRKSSIVSAGTEYKHFNSRSQALREFNNQATQERGKFERENIGSNFGQQSAGSKATMAVVTLVLSIDGDSTNVPQIGSIGDVENALRKIASDSKMDDCLQSVEILWTPEERSETLSRQDIIADYPTLRSV